MAVVEVSGRYASGVESPRTREGEFGVEYVIAWANETSIGRDILITACDVRQIQLAKAALYVAARLPHRSFDPGPRDRPDGGPYSVEPTFEKRNGPGMVGMDMNASGSSRSDILNLLRGARTGRVPCFSGLITICLGGPESPEWHLSDVYASAERLAAAACDAHRRSAIGSAVVPLDLCVEAEALGAEIDFHHGSEPTLYPTVKVPLATSPGEFPLEVSTDFLRRGRIPVVLEAIRRLKADVGQTAVVGAFVPGPMTLAMQVIALDGILLDVVRDPKAVAAVLDALTGPLIEIGNAYRAAGADFITVHEMGGSPGVIGPKAFESLVQPRLRRLLAALPAPRVLSVCGRTNHAMSLLAGCGAEALSVDQLNDLRRSRETLGPGVLIFGNLDPVAVLAEGDEAAIRAAVRRAIDDGADAVWPGCDLWPLTPAGNLRTMVEEASRNARPLST